MVRPGAAEAGQQRPQLIGYEKLPVSAHDGGLLSPLGHNGGGVACSGDLLAPAPAGALLSLLP
jgi:hypothetical protein